MPYSPGDNVAIYLGGKLRGHFEKQLWGDEAGALVDRFGITWMFTITLKPEPLAG